jgi:hypothetical protein
MLSLLGFKFLQSFSESETCCLAEINQIITALAKRFEGGCSRIFCGSLSACSTSSSGVGNGGRRYISLLTPSLDSEVHFCFRGMGDGVAAELDIRTGIRSRSDRFLEEAECVMGRLYFFMMKKRNALPRVWSSFSI